MQEIQKSLEDIQGEMEEEHQQMYSEIKLNNEIIRKIIDELHSLDNDFERRDISDDKWRSNDD